MLLVLGRISSVVDRQVLGPGLNSLMRPYFFLIFLLQMFNLFYKWKFYYNLHKIWCTPINNNVMLVGMQFLFNKICLFTLSVELHLASPQQTVERVTEARTRIFPWNVNLTHFSKTTMSLQNISHYIHCIIGTFAVVLDKLSVLYVCSSNYYTYK